MLAALWVGVLTTVLALVAEAQGGQIDAIVLAAGGVLTLIWVTHAAFTRALDERRAWRGLRSLTLGRIATGLAVPALALFALFLHTLLPAARGPLSVVGFFLVLLTSATIKWHLRDMPTVVVVGNADFREHVIARAEINGRQVLTCAERSDENNPLAITGMRVDEGSVGNDELLVQADCFERVYQISPELRARCSRLIIMDHRDTAPINAPVSIREWERPFDNPIPAGGRILKRTIDLVFAPLLMLLGAPVLLGAAIAIVVDTRSNPIFRQERVGLDGRTFTLYKFRTMNRHGCDVEHQQYVAALIRGEAPIHGGMHKLTGDGRITRVGKTLRHFSIDELPQLWNVVRGDMTLIGPRPPLPRETEMYDAHSWRRLRVKPGLTGLWQVSGRCELTFREMVSLDIAYWQSWNPLLDLSILLRTPWAVISGRGAA